MPGGGGHRGTAQREETEPEERPECVTCLFLSHLTDIVVDIIVKFFDFAFFFFFKFEVHVLFSS